MAIAVGGDRMGGQELAVQQIHTFFILNGSIAAWSALFASREVWAIYNGGVAYLLMGALFAGEWLFRRHVRSSH